MKPPTATLRSVAERAPIGYVVVACFLSFACYNLVPGSGTAADVARTAAGALCAVALLAVGDPAALRPRSGQSVVRLCVWLVAVACAVGAGSLLASGVFDVAAPIAPGAAAGAGAGPSAFAGCGRAGQRSGCCGCRPAGAIRLPVPCNRAVRGSAVPRRHVSRLRVRVRSVRSREPLALGSRRVRRRVRRTARVGRSARRSARCRGAGAGGPQAGAGSLVRLRDGRRVRTFAQPVACLWSACRVQRLVGRAVVPGFRVSSCHLSDRKRGRRGAACRRFRAAGAGRRQRPERGSQERAFCDAGASQSTCEGRRGTILPRKRPAPRY